MLPHGKVTARRFSRAAGGERPIPIDCVEKVRRGRSVSLAANSSMLYVS
jgi:hypothetical protein